jgi:small-conductance mechanosensitive channel/CRP-like cAMP-binding protein
VRDLLAPALLVVASSLALAGAGLWLPGLSSSGQLGSRLELVLRVIAWAGATWLCARLLVRSVRFRVERRSGGRPAPKLMLDLIGGVAWLAGLSAMSVYLFDVTPSAAFTTSGVLVAVVGFAVRHLVADLFYGVTLALERPFEIGDWVELRDGMVGQVEEMTWRAVKLVTYDNLKLVVPNGQVATEQIANYDQPDPTWRKRIRITLGYDVSPAEVDRLLRAAIEQVPETASIPREPDARVVEYEARGVVWELRFWLPEYDTASHVTQRVHEALLRGLHVAGIQHPRVREELLVGVLDRERASERDAARRWIERIDLFAPLAEEERTLLQQCARRLTFTPGDAVVEQGQEGSSLFVIHEGALQASTGDDSAREALGTMGPGEVFGEMSLLTGAARSASVTARVPSVVFEIGREALEPLLKGNEGLARELAVIVAERTLADSRRDAERSQHDRVREHASRTGELVARIRFFFSLPGSTPPGERSEPGASLGTP